MSTKLRAKRSLHRLHLSEKHLRVKSLHRLDERLYVKSLHREELHMEVPTEQQRPEKPLPGNTKKGGKDIR